MKLAFHSLKTFIAYIREHWLSYSIGVSGWVVLVCYFIYEYAEHPSVPSLLEHFLDTSSLVLPLHLSPPCTLATLRTGR